MTVPAKYEFQFLSPHSSQHLVLAVFVFHFNHSHECEVVIVVLILIHSINLIISHVLTSLSYIFFYKVPGQILCLFLIGLLVFLLLNYMNYSYYLYSSPLSHICVVNISPSMWLIFLFS